MRDYTSYLYLLLLLLIGGCLPGFLYAQDTLYVDASAQGLNNGSSWTHAYEDLPFALTTADYGDQIWVAEGTCFPTEDGDRTATFTLPNGQQDFIDACKNMFGEAQGQAFADNVIQANTVIEFSSLLSLSQLGSTPKALFRTDDVNELINKAAMGRYAEDYKLATGEYLPGCEPDALKQMGNASETLLLSGKVKSPKVLPTEIEIKHADYYDLNTSLGPTFILASDKAPLRNLINRCRQAIKDFPDQVTDEMTISKVLRDIEENNPGTLSLLNSDLTSHPKLIDFFAEVSDPLKIQNRVKAWEGLFNTSLRTDIPWLTRASKWLDEGAEIVEGTSTTAIIRKNGEEIGKIVDSELQPSKFLAGGTKIDDAGSGYDFYKLANGEIGFRARFVTEFEYGEAVIELENGTQVGSGGIGPGGLLETEIETVVGDVKLAKGENVFNEIYDLASSSGNVMGVRGLWNQALPDNLNTFNDLIVNQVNPGFMTLEEAALQTFTGKMATNKGFTNVSKITPAPQNPNNTYTQVTVEFTN